MATYTEHYGLHQWLPEDNFLRTDFNTDLEKIDTALGEVRSELPSIVTGSYVGTGEYGGAFRKELEIGLAAQLVLIMRDDGNSQLSALFLRPCQIGLGGFDNNSHPGLIWTDTGVSWSAVDIYGAAGILNASGVTYRWWAIG